MSTDMEWLVDLAIRNGDITVSRGAEILGIGIEEMRAIGLALHPKAISELTPMDLLVAENERLRRELRAAR